MYKRTRFQTLLLLLIVTAGCTTYHPLPVDRPTITDYNKHKDTSNDAIPIPANILESKQYAWTFSEFYRQRKIEIQRRIFNHSDASLFGALVAMAAGAAKSPEGVLGGGAFAAGAEIAPGRYQFAVQETNYGNAEKAATCVFDNLRRLSGEDELALSTYEVVIGRRDEKTVGDLTHFIMKMIHSRLESAQSKVVLTSADLDKLQDVLEKAKKPQLPDPSTLQAAENMKAALLRAREEDGTASLTVMNIPINAADIPGLATKGDSLYKTLEAKFDVCAELVGTGS